MKKILTVLLACAILIMTVPNEMQATGTTATAAPESVTSNKEATDSVSDSKISWPKGPSKNSISAESAIVMELNTGTILYSKNIHDEHYPASITKIMTTLLCLENSSLTDTVTYSSNAVNSIEYGSSHIAIVADEQMSMEDSLYGIMLMSANEACNGVAEHVAGSIDGFVDMMNAKAKELGCKNTHFANPNGLFLKDHYSSAYDMALIAKAAMSNSVFRKITGTRRYTIPATNKNEERGLFNKHEMLNPRKYPKYGYDYCIGGKTGYTNIARWTLVTFAKKDDLELVCVVMKTAGPPPSEPNEYTDTTKLLDYAFDNYKKFPLNSSSLSHDEGEYSLFTRYNKFFDEDDSPLYLQNNAGVVLPNGVDISQAERKVEYYNNKKLEEGENVIGKVTYTYGDKEAGSADILYNTDKVERTDLTEAVTKMVSEAEAKKAAEQKKKDEESLKAEQKKAEDSEKSDKSIIDRFKSLGVIGIIIAVLIIVGVGFVVFVLIRRARLRKRYFGSYRKRSSIGKRKINNGHFDRYDKF